MAAFALALPGKPKQYSAFQILQSLCNAGFSLVFILVAGGLAGKSFWTSLAIGIFSFFSLALFGMIC